MNNIQVFMICFFTYLSVDSIAKAIKFRSLAKLNESKVLDNN